MKKKILTALLIFILFTIGAKAQVSIRDFSVDSKYLQGNDILLSKDPTQVEFKVTISSVKSISYAAKLQIQFAYVGQPWDTTKEAYMSNDLVGNDGFYSTVIKVDIPKNRAGQLFRLNVRVEPTNGVAYDVPSNNTYKCIPQSVVTPVITDISNNIITLKSGPNVFDDLIIEGSKPSGGDGNYKYEWEYSDMAGDGVQTSPYTFVFKIDNVNTMPLRKVYVRRKITSGGRISYSNVIKDIYPSYTGDQIKIEHVSGGHSHPEASIPVFYEGDEAVFRISNPQPNVTYKWYYVIASPGIGFGRYLGTSNSNITFTMPSQRFSRPDYVCVVGSDNSYQSFPFLLTIKEE